MHRSPSANSSSATGSTHLQAAVALANSTRASNAQIIARSGLTSAPITHHRSPAKPSSADSSRPQSSATASAPAQSSTATESASPQQLESMQVDLRRIQLVLDLGPSAAGLGSTPDVNASSNVEGGRSSAGNRLNSAVGGSSRKGGATEVDSSSKGKQDKLGAEIEGVIAQATASVLAEASANGPQQSPSPEQSAAVRAALLQLFCCRTGHLLSVLCTTLGGLPNNASLGGAAWARAAAAVSNASFKDRAASSRGARPSSGIANKDRSSAEGNGQGSPLANASSRPSSSYPPSPSNTTQNGASPSGLLANNGAGAAAVNGGSKGPVWRGSGLVSMHPMVQAVSDVAGCLTQYKSVRQEREETLQKMESLRKKLLGLQQDNTLLRNAMENEASKFRCSECAKQDTGQSSQKQDSPLLMTLNKSLQTQLQQAQQQLLQQQKKAKDQVDEQKTEVLSWKNKAHAAQRKVDELLAQRPEQDAEAKQMKLEAGWKEAVAQKTRAETELRVAKQEILELKKAQSAHNKRVLQDAENGSTQLAVQAAAEVAAAKADAAVRVEAVEQQTAQAERAAEEARAAEQQTALALKAAEAAAREAEQQSAQQLELAEAAAKTAEQQATEAVQALEAIEQDKRKLQASLDVAERVIADRTAQLVAGRKKLAAAEAEAAELKVQLAQAQSQLEEAWSKEKAQAEARALHAKASEEAKAKIRSLEAQLGAAKEQASQAKAGIAGLEESLRKAEERALNALKDKTAGQEEAQAHLKQAQEHGAAAAAHAERAVSLESALEVESQQVQRLREQLKEALEMQASQLEALEQRAARAEAACERADADAAKVRKLLYTVKAEAEAKEEQFVQEKEQLETLRATLEKEIASVRAMNTLSQAKTMRFDISTLNSATAAAATPTVSCPTTGRPASGMPPSVFLQKPSSARPGSGKDQAAHARLGHIVRDLQQQLIAEKIRAENAITEAAVAQQRLQQWQRSVTIQKSWSAEQEVHEEGQAEGLAEGVQTEGKEGAQLQGQEGDVFENGKQLEGQEEAYSQGQHEQIEMKEARAEGSPTCPTSQPSGKDILEEAVTQAISASEGEAPQCPPSPAAGSNALWQSLKGTCL